MKKSICAVDHHQVLTSANLAPWLSWPRVSIEDFSSGKSFETRRCPACQGEFRRQIFVSAVVYPIEVSLLRSPVEEQARALAAVPGWPTDLGAFGRVLHRRRNAAGLTRCALSELCNVSEGTIRSIESSLHRPTRNIIERLTAVPQLQEITAQENAVDAPAPPLRISMKHKPPAPS